MLPALKSQAFFVAELGCLIRLHVFNPRNERLELYEPRAALLVFPHGELCGALNVEFDIVRRPAFAPEASLTLDVEN